MSEFVYKNKNSKFFSAKAKSPIGTHLHKFKDFPGKLRAAYKIQSWRWLSCAHQPGEICQRQKCPAGKPGSPEPISGT
jgi:hypothetical protein